MWLAWDVLENIDLTTVVTRFPLIAGSQNEVRVHNIIVSYNYNYRIWLSNPENALLVNLKKSQSGSLQSFCGDALLVLDHVLASCDLHQLMLEQGYIYEIASIFI